jgi:hypothetical protein
MYTLRSAGGSCHSVPRSGKNLAFTRRIIHDVEVGLDAHETDFCHRHCGTVVFRDVWWCIVMGEVGGGVENGLTQSGAVGSSSS